MAEQFARGGVDDMDVDVDDQEGDVSAADFDADVVGAAGVAEVVTVPLAGRRRSGHGATERVGVVRVALGWAVQEESEWRAATAGLPQERR